MFKTPGERLGFSEKESAAMTTDFTPRIVVFACNWCSYAGADLAGVGRLQYPTGIRLIRLMCSGMFSPTFALRAFEQGADGVLLAGCHLGDCHYYEGNYKALKAVEKTERILKLLGVEEGRFRREWIAASEGQLFAEVMADFTERLRQLGPNPFARRGSGNEPAAVAGS
jgi:F420-non-reducing hydrogenase iron-sulfur subunit